MRLIDADELVRTIHDKLDKVIVWDESEATTADEFEEIVDEIPTANVQAVKHGKWKYIPEAKHTCAVYVCSVCNFCRLSPNTPLECQYCPRCGAKMNGEEI